MNPCVRSAAIRFLYLNTLFTASCGQTTFVSSNGPFKGPAADDAEQSNNRAKTANEAFEKLYRRQRPVTGIAQVKNNYVPVVNVPDFKLPDLFLQISRCDANTVIKGIYDEFDSEHESLNSLNTAKIYFNRNNFWDVVESRCAAVNLAQPQQEFLDIAAPSGSWKWYMRACFPIDAGKLMCSRIIFETAPLENYINKLSAEQSELSNEISRKIFAIRLLTSAFPEKASRLLTALEECQSSDIDNAGRQLVRSILINFIGMGSAIIFRIFGPSMPQMNNWTDKIGELWRPDPNVQNSGQYVTRILLWLFTQQHDFKQTCTRAEEIRIESLQDVMILQKLQLELATRLDKASTLGLPTPPEVLK
jgi:hypothetical protein